MTNPKELSGSGVYIFLLGLALSNHGVCVLNRIVNAEIYGVKFVFDMILRLFERW